MRCAVLLFVAGCAFDMPGQESAQQQCMRYVEAIDAKSADCGDTKPPDHDGNVAHCGKVMAVNPLLSVDRCIDEVRNAECAMSHQNWWCSAFVEEK